MGVRERKTLSIIIPCYNEEEVIASTIARIREVSQTLEAWSVEIVLVDDGSNDSTVRTASSAAEALKTPLVLVQLSRNFGHQAAITAGLQQANGELVAIMDADLQDPPELLPAMIEKISEGYEVVYGRRIARHGVPLWKKISYRAYYRLLRFFSSDYKIPLDTGDFRVMTRQIVTLLQSLPEHVRFHRGLTAFLGFPQAYVEYERPARAAGNPKYSLASLISLAANGIVSFSIRPLKIAGAVGAMMFALALIGVILVFAIRLGTNEWVPGWAGTMIVILSFGGLQFVFLGIIGEYIGRIFLEVKGRPAFIVGQVHKLNPAGAADKKKDVE